MKRNIVDDAPNDPATNPLDVECPVCHAPIGEVCWTPLEYPMPKPHIRRIQAAEAAVQLTLDLADG